MIATALDSAKLFLAGKLFRDLDQVLIKLGIGVACGALVVIVLGLFAPAWLAVLGGGAVAGYLQPILFKDLKYA